MRTWLMLVIVLMCQCLYAGTSERSFRMIYRDYTTFDISERPLSAGAILWETKELPDHPGIFGSISMVKYGRIRLEAGGTAVWNEKKVRVEIGMLTGLAYEIGKNWIVGAWAEPFWNAYGKHPDDAVGIMVGYTFGVN